MKAADMYSRENNSAVINNLGCFLEMYKTICLSYLGCVQSKSRFTISLQHGSVEIGNMTYYCNKAIACL